MTEKCETTACELSKSDHSDIFDNDSHTGKAAALKEIADTELQRASGLLNQTNERSRDLHIDYVDGRIRSALLQDLAKTRDAVLQENPLKPDSPEVAARKSYLTSFFTSLPQAFLYRAAAEGLTENQMKIAFSNTMHALKESGYDPSVEIDEKIPPAPVKEERDERLNNPNSPITYEKWKELRNTVLPNITGSLVNALKKSLPLEEKKPPRYDVARFQSVTALQLDYLVKLHADRAYVKDSYLVNPVTEAEVIKKYIKAAATLLLDCIKSRQDRLTVHAAMEKAI